MLTRLHAHTHTLFTRLHVRKGRRSKERLKPTTAVSPIVITDSKLARRVLSVLNIVQKVPNAATASESEAIAWLLSSTQQLNLLARAAGCSVPATSADVER